MRGNLIQKYPDSVIFMVKGVEINDGEQVIVKPGLEEYAGTPSEYFYPIFTAEVATDIILLGFNITLSDVKENEWFFVIQERPFETRFGLDAPNSITLESCDDIAWDHFDFDGDGAPDSYEEQVDKYLNGLNPIEFESQDAFTEWSANAASLASCALQKPVRIVVSSNKMIPNNW